MSLLLQRNRSTFPTLVSDFFNSGSLLPGVLDFDLELPDHNGGSLLVPGANIIENEKDFSLELAAPGLERKDFKVEVENGLLCISAEREESKKENNKNYRRKEFSYHAFSRSFTLPENCLSDKIEARYDNGILRLTLPKKEITISKPVKEIKVS